MSSVFPGLASTAIVSVGEALFDCFPDRTILGGAPVNFIVHLQQLLGSSGHAALVSRIGHDELGGQVLRQLKNRGISTEHVQIDDRRPTGRVQVRMSKSGEPEYEIAEGVAWDFLTFDAPLTQLAKNCSAVCFGTLAQRSIASRTVIDKLLENATKAIRLLDVNLRQHYFTRQILESSFTAATVVKLNEEELVTTSASLSHWIGDAVTIDERAFGLRQAFNLDLLALTRGAQGTVLYTREGRLEAKPATFPPTENADSVGAGDACGAGLVYGLLMRWPYERTLELANRMGAFVASQPGGTPQLSQGMLDCLGL
jgi:fructokinase